jgi:hypothetical protein
MEPFVFTPAFELFFVIEPFRETFDELREMLSPLSGDNAPDLIGSDIYYRSETDVALLALRFDERTMSLRRLQWVLQLAKGAGVPVLDPSKLSDDDRRAFYRSYLDEYEVRIEDMPNAGAAMFELARRQRLVTGTPTPRERAGTEAPRRVPTEVGEGGVVVAAHEQLLTDREPMPLPTMTPPSSQLPEQDAHPPSAAQVPPGGRGALGKLAPSHRSPDERARMTIDEQAERARLQAHTPRPDSLTAADLEDVDLKPRARGKGRRSNRSPTMPASPAARKGRDRRAATQPLVSPAPPTPDASTDIDVRFLRGGIWVPARLRALSAKSAYLVTGAPPRLGDSVHVALGFRGQGAMVRGTVHHVTTVDDAAATGSSGFAVRFARYESPSRRQLVELLKQARACGVVIKPPPPRGSVRFPVHWPLRLGTSRGGFRADALDVSEGGLFVSTDRVIDADEVVFRLPLDDDARAIHGRANIARKISDEVASSRGLERGYGLRIVELSTRDDQNYRRFLGRVRRRTEKRVVVGARADRLDELVDGLQSVGYSVTGGSDPGVLVRLADFEPRPPDAAVIDASLAPRGLRGDWLQQVFTTRHVPCVTTDGDTAERTRAVVDRLLRVAA